MYKIDLPTLLRLFEEFQRSGTLTADIPRGVFGLKEPGFAMVELINGKIATCSIARKDGSYLASGRTALQMLQQADNLKWQIPESLPELSKEAGSLLPITEAPPPLNTPRRYLPPVTVPQRRIIPNQSILNSLTPKQRRVLSLADGTRNVSKIAGLLAISVEEAQWILGELEAMQLITEKQ